MQSINLRKRPVQSRAKAKVENILEGATRILMREGLDKLNTNNIAKTAGVSVGTLYQYFPTKEAILTELIRQKRRRLLEGLNAATAFMESESFEETLNKLIKATIEHQIKWPKLAKTLEYAEVFLPLEEETNELNKNILQTVTRLLLLHNIEDAQRSAVDIVGALRGLIDAAGLSGETDKKDLQLRSAKLVLGYLRIEGQESLK